MFRFVIPNPSLATQNFWPNTVEEALLDPEIASLGEDILRLIYPVNTYMEAFTVTKMQHAAALIDDPKNFGEFTEDEAGQAIRNKYLLTAYRNELGEIGAELASLLSSELEQLPEPHVSVAVECHTLPIVDELLVQGIVVAAVDIKRDTWSWPRFFMVLGAFKE